MKKPFKKNKESSPMNMNKLEYDMMITYVSANTGVKKEEVDKVIRFVDETYTK